MHSCCSTKRKRHAFIALVALLVAVSWLGVLDQAADDYTDGAIIQAGSAYAVARGINATVSVLQSSTISFSFGVGGSIAVGEILDPINDLIERFSESVTVALGSLVLQKILLKITANKVFSVILTLVGALLVWAAYFSKLAWARYLTKLFIILVVVRFSLGLVVLANSMVHQLFLSDSIAENSRQMEQFDGDIKNLQRSVKLSPAQQQALKTAIAHDQSLLKQIKEQRLPKTERALAAVQQKLAHAEQEKEKAERDAGLMGKFDGVNPWTDNKKMLAARKKITQIDEKRQRIEATKQRLADQITSLQDSIDENRAALENVSGLVDRVKNWKTELTELKAKLEEKTQHFVQYVIDLLMLFILQAVLLPMLFFYLLIKLIKMVWNTHWDMLLAS